MIGQVQPGHERDGVALVHGGKRARAEDAERPHEVGLAKVRLGKDVGVRVKDVRLELRPRAADVGVVPGGVGEELRALELADLLGGPEERRVEGGGERRDVRRPSGRFADGSLVEELEGERDPGRLSVAVRADGGGDGGLLGHPQGFRDGEDRLVAAEVLRGDEAPSASAGGEIDGGGAHVGDVDALGGEPRPEGVEVSLRRDGRARVGGAGDGAAREGAASARDARGGGRGRRRAAGRRAGARRPRRG